MRGFFGLRGHSGYYTEIHFGYFIFLTDITMNKEHSVGKREKHFPFYLKNKKSEKISKNC